MTMFESCFEKGQIKCWIIFQNIFIGWTPSSGANTRTLNLQLQRWRFF
jgi:hypothetical protein